MFSDLFNSNMGSDWDNKVRGREYSTILEMVLFSEDIVLSLFEPTTLCIQTLLSLQVADSLAGWVFMNLRYTIHGKN